MTSSASHRAINTHGQAAAALGRGKGGVGGESQQLTKIGFDFLCRGVMLTNIIKEENKCVRFL